MKFEDEGAQNSLCTLASTLYYLFVCLVGPGCVANAFHADGCGAFTCLIRPHGSEQKFCGGLQFGVTVPKALNEASCILGFGELGFQYCTGSEQLCTKSVSFLKLRHQIFCLHRSVGLVPTAHQTVKSNFLFPFGSLDFQFFFSLLLFILFLFLLSLKVFF